MQFSVAEKTFSAVGGFAALWDALSVTPAQPRQGRMKLARQELPG